MRRLLAVASLAVAFAGIATIAGPTPARACSCATPSVRPADGATDVPRNARIWVPAFRSDDMNVRILREGVEEIAFDVGAIEHSSGMFVLVLTPRAPLAPSTRYQVKAALTYSNPQPTSFTTGETFDTTSPGVPMGKLAKVCAALTPNSSCGPYYRGMEFEIPTDDSPLVVLTLGEQPLTPSLDSLPTSSPLAGPIPILADRWPLRTPTLWLGQGACSRWPLEQTRGTIFYGAIDLAGNFSGWRAGGPVALPDYPTVVVPDHDGHCVDPSMANMGGGPPPVDSGPPPVDSGPPPDGATASSSGSGCGIAGRGVPGSWSAALLLGALGLIIGDRRRPRDHNPVTGTSPGGRPAAPGR